VSQPAHRRLSPPQSVREAGNPLASRAWHRAPLLRLRDGSGVVDARGAGLRARERECALLEELLADVRHSVSRSLVVRGEAGIGKTALLRYLIDSATDMSVVSAAGVESEMELAYASLHQVCAPLFDRLERLPLPQRQALETVFGVSAGPPPDRFLVGLGVL